MQLYHMNLSASPAPAGCEGLGQKPVGVTRVFMSPAVTSSSRYLGEIIYN